SYSADKGKTWSRPVIVNDDRSPEEMGKGPDHILPSLAVNNAGVVLVTWYDRRDAQDNLGWRLRAAASLDGGEPFPASAPVASELARLDDVSKQLKFEVVQRTFDRGSGMNSMVVRLRNASKDTIVGPVKLRLRTLESQLGVPEVVGADNGERGTGATWDFSGT